MQPQAQATPPSSGAVPAQSAGESQPPNSPANFAQFLKMMVVNMVKGYIKNLPKMLIVGALVLVIHTVAMVIYNEGFNSGEGMIGDAVLSLKGQFVGGNVFWLLLGAIATLIWSKIQSGTLGQSFKNVTAAPSYIQKARSEIGPEQVTLLCAGAGAAWALSSLFTNPLVCIQATFLTLGAVTRREKSLLVLATQLVVRDAKRIFGQPQLAAVLSSSRVSIVLGGLGLGFLTAIIMPRPLSGFYGYGIALLLLVVAFVQAKSGSKRNPALPSLFILLAIFVFMATPLLADDGGWQESGGNLAGWIRSAGAIPAVLISAFPALGFGLGLGLGTIIDAGFGGITGFPPQEPPPQQPPETPQTIEWTSPQGRTYVLEKQPDGNYINILTGGLVDGSQIDEWKQRTGQIESDHRAFSDQERDKMQRGDTAMDRELKAIKDRAAARDKMYQNLSTMEKGVMFGSGGAGDLYKPPGDPGNILDRIKELRDQLSKGGTYDKDKYDRVRQVYGGAQSGRTITENRLPTSNELTRDVISGTVGNTVKEFVTGKKSDGSVSWLGIGGRALTAGLTGGASELVMTPASALGTMKDYVDKGGNSAWEGFKEASKEVLIGEAIGRGVQVVGAIAGATSTMVKEIIKDSAASGNSLAKGIVNGVNAIKGGIAGAKEAIKDTLGAARDQVKGVIDKAKNSLGMGGKSLPPKVYGTSSVGSVGKQVAGAASKAEAAAASAEGKAVSTATSAEGKAAAAKAGTSAEGKAASAATSAEGKAAAAKAGTSAEGKAASAAKSAEGKAASSTAAKPAGAPASVSKPVSAAEANANKAARAQARAAQTGEGKYGIKKDSGVNVQSQTKGMTTPAQKHAQVIADKNGVKIDVRSTTKYAHDPIATGKAVPKAPWCKSKTINDLDVKLGAKADNKGLAGYFEPKKPVQGNMSDADFKKLMSRYNERSQEFKDQFDHLTKLKGEGKCYVKDGVVIDTKSGKPYTGDHDIFDIRDATTGKPLPRYQVDPKGNVVFNPDGTPKLNPVREQIIKDLQQPPFSAQHGAHMDWKYDHLGKELPEGAPAGAQSDFDIAKGVDKGVLGKHTQDGGDALITFGADEAPTGSWFEGER